MYCSSCGVAVAQGLTYCNYCGANLGGAKAEPEFSEPRPESLVFAMMAVFIFGLAAIMGLMSVMKKVLELNEGALLGITLFTFLILLMLEGVFISLLLRRKRGTKETGEIIQAKRQATRELDAANARALPEPLPSVTEGTTRTFEPIYNERTSK